MNKIKFTIVHECFDKLYEEKKEFIDSYMGLKGNLFTQLYVDLTTIVNNTKLFYLLKDKYSELKPEDYLFYRIKDYVGLAYKRDILKEIIDIARENVELVEFN